MTYQAQIPAEKKPKLSGPKKEKIEIPVDNIIDTKKIKPTSSIRKSDYPKKKKGATRKAISLAELKRYFKAAEDTAKELLAEQTLSPRGNPITEEDQKNLENDFSKLNNDLSKIIFQ